MAKVTYDKALTALLVIDPYSDFISEGGKVWDRLKGVAEANRRDGHRRCWYDELAAVTTGGRMLRRPPEPHRPMIHRQEHT
jgi:ureidoacrylate peracid hydrolase